MCTKFDAIWVVGTRWIKLDVLTQTIKKAEQNICLFNNTINTESSTLEAGNLVNPYMEDMFVKFGTNWVDRTGWIGMDVLVTVTQTIQKVESNICLFNNNSTTWPNYLKTGIGFF